MAKEYITPEKRYEDHKSTGYIFLILGISGLVATIFCWLDIFKLPLNQFQLGILLAMFITFCGFGAWSFKKAGEIASTMTSENDKVATMRHWIAENRDSFCVSDFSGLSGSEAYFQREQDIHDAITNQFPEIEENLLELFVEETYQALFEQM